MKIKKKAGFEKRLSSKLQEWSRTLKAPAKWRSLFSFSMKVWLNMNDLL
jgi:hypothetical protein